jgi:hypothetical protein
MSEKRKKNFNEDHSNSKSGTSSDRLSPSAKAEKPTRIDSSKAVYRRYDEKDLPKGIKIWPKDMREPTFGSSMPETPNLKNGLYFNFWPDGQLKMVISVKNHKVVEWLKLEQGIAEGCWATMTGTMAIAQKYYSNGQMEDFHPWADSDPPYPAEVSFEGWVNPFLNGIRKVMGSK